MEFWYRAGEEKERVSASIDPLIDSSSSSTIPSYSYFTQQAILAGIDIGNLRKDRPNTTKESLLEEIRKKRLREEMLLKEIACKRMLEEEILRELENGSKLENKDAWSGSEFESSSFVNQMTNNGFTEIRFMNELKKAESLITDEPAKFSKPEMPGISLDRKFPGSKLPGVRRKASSSLSDSAKKEWSCSLCRVTTSSENNLNVHINGKKHKAKEARLINHSTTSSKKSKALYTFDKDDVKPLIEGKDIAIDEHADEADQARKINQSNQKDTNTWCRNCKGCCNSPPMLQIHQCWGNHKPKSEANTSESAEAVTKEITEEKIIKEVDKDQDVEADEETLAKHSYEASKETLLIEHQANVEANEENIDKNNV